MKTKTTITELTKEDLVNLLSGALYGSPYLSAEYDVSVEYDEDDSYEEIMANILLNGGAIKVTDSYADGCFFGSLRHESNEDNDATYHVRYIDILNGLEKAANGTFNTCPEVGEVFAERNAAFARQSFKAFAHYESAWDAVTADCLMQIILFNEIVYG